MTYEGIAGIGWMGCCHTTQRCYGNPPAGAECQQELPAQCETCAGCNYGICAIRAGYCDGWHEE
ncbi:hypothetical protein FACS1894151_10610 [Spirochaetia bacterium]|nr:hypothetical protein FACS1894151_10610 [Spirochaetia bacterium]